MTITQLLTLELLSPHSSTSTSLTSPPLNHLLTSLCARQPVHSAYPVTLYTDLHSASIFYLLSGWRDQSAILSWTKEWEDADSTSCREVCKKLREYVKVRESVFLDMDFDRIPRGAKGSGRVLCVVRNSIGGDNGDDNHGGDGNTNNDNDGEEGVDCEGIQIGHGDLEVSGTAGTFTEDESSCRSEFSSEEDDPGSDTEPCRIEWIGGGHTLRVLEQPNDDNRARPGKNFHSFLMYSDGTSERVLRRVLGCRTCSRDFTAMRRISIPRPVMASAALVYTGPSR
ncbi:hypothetical protein E1B28_009315 [Marasmius oreades]|uniref:Uncharacterized protein n=1 Tax=Marasmius oreades TaxID=181124 RepID=A0A9P7UV69_9AGAR|nr:uncharacterized protein E1B28_009315 [Marasmius oreades]KAG7093019.1 hypothetical protein E1B28_009315 [Marasmius oreades]